MIHEKLEDGKLPEWGFGGLRCRGFRRGTVAELRRPTQDPPTSDNFEVSCYGSAITMLSPYQRFANALMNRKERWFGKARTSFLRNRSLFEGKIGLEIGGPSGIFHTKELLPVYACAARIDGVNFANSTLWEGEIREGAGYRYAPGHAGQQFICEASNLTRISDRTYDFVLSSHSLEHSANPLKCMAEWTRVLKPGGGLLLILPDSRLTFDHRRPVTSFQHLLDDHRKDIGEDDLTHLDEILALHDLSRDLEAGSAENFRTRSLRNLDYRALHQHIFDKALLRQLLGHLNVMTLCVEAAPPFHIVALGTTASLERQG